MRSIRFSDKVLCDDDDDGDGVGVVGRMGGVASSASATPRRNGFALREMGHHRRSSSSRLERGYHVSSAASDTSSAAGFGVMSMPRRSSNNNLERSGRASALARSYAIDNEYDLMPASMSFSGSGAALLPRSSQDYSDELDYRGSVHGSSVTASSPYSPRSADSSSYHGSNRPSSTVPLEPILKNGTLPRSHSRASAGYGTLDSRQTYKSPNTSYIPQSSSIQHDFNGRSSSRVNSYGNGSVVNGSSSSRLMPPLSNGNAVGTYRNGSGNEYPPSVGISGRNSNLHQNSSNTLSNMNNKSINNNNNVNNNNGNNGNANHLVSASSTNYPRGLPKTSPSMQIIATRHRPCCDCGCLGHLARQTSGANTPNGQQPICVLFSVFLIVSLLLVSGIMLYLRGDYVTNLLSSSPPSSTSSSSSSSTTSSKHHTALSTKRCDEGLCAFGAVCVSTPNGGSRCQCEDSCPFVYNPVCGSDGVTYDNECKLKLAACQKKRLIRQVADGACGGYDPCSSLTCPQYSICVPAFDGTSASCQCPQHCSEDVVNQVVCGTDGRDYASQCHLEKEACEKRRDNLEVRFQGRCNPCQMLSCDSGTECHLVPDDPTDDHTREAKCMCSNNCPDDFVPICGSNGKTYLNECVMKLDGCRRRLDLHLVYTGNCSSGLNQCKLLNCEFGQECEINKQGITNCICPESCEKIVRPVCASNGQTYDNECEMKKYGCRKKMALSIQYIGNCDSNGPCSKRTCNHHSICVESEDLAFCECPKCAEEYAPVCGSDGSTYHNVCKLQRAACQQETSIVVVEQGPCSGCANKTCDLYAVCHGDGFGNGLCQCPTSCEQIPNADDKEQVCGTDGQTYPSECHLKMEACRKQQFIVVANYGNCDLCRDVQCKHGAHCESGVCVCPTHCPNDVFEPLCGSDLVTYANECEMLKRTCQKDSQVTLLHHGTCTQSNGLSACSCSPFGSVRSDCEQTSGRCVCKPGILGPKCDTCPDGMKVSPIGCEGLYFPFGGEIKKCGNETCNYGAQCSDDLVCTCDIECPPDTQLTPVCGNDGNTYRSECQLLQYSCRYKKHVLITSYTPCREGRPPYTYSPAFSTMSPSHANYNPFDQFSTDLSPKPTSDRYPAPNNVDDLQNNHPVMFQESPCANNPCFGGGTCEEHDGTFTCFCPSNRIGERCERRLSESDVQVPSFDGRLSYVELEPLENVEHKFSLEIEFKARAINGILIYAQEKPNGLGDFISVALIDGHVEFRYNLGSGVAIIRTLKKISLNRWHRVQAKRWHKDGMLKLDHHENVDGSSQGTQRSLDIAEPTFVGGMPPSLPSSQVLLNVDLSASNYAFEGCIRKFKLGYREVKVQSASEPSSVRREGLRECSDVPNGDVPSSSKAASCSTHQCDNGGTCVPMDGRVVQCLCPPNYYGEHCRDTTENTLCASSPCLNGGTCSESPSRHDFYCMCPLDATGRFCELKTYQASVLPSITTTSSTTAASPSLNSQPPSMNSIHGQESVVVHNEVYSTTASASFFVPRFSGNSFLELPTLRHVGKSFQIEVWFLSHKPEGMLLYNGQNSNGHGDFLSLNLVDRHVQMRYDLGSGLANLTTLEQITLGQWHAVKITRNGPHGTIQLDQGSLVSGASFAPLTELNLELPLYLGGFRFSYSLSRESGIFSGLDGAIQRLIVNGNLMENLMDHVKDSQNIGHYVGPPCEQTPCQNGGVCRPFYRSYTCKCSGGFVGQHCEKGIGQFNKRSAVLFDGETHLSFMNKVNKLP